MKTKTRLLLLLTTILIVSAGLSSASTPDYTVSHLIDDQVTNGDNDIGDLLFIELPYKAQVYTMSSVQNYTVQRFDRMRWQGSEAIRITAPSGQETEIVSGNEYPFPETGVYNVETASQSNNHTATITVSQKDPNRIILQPVSVPEGIELSFSKDNFTLDNEQTVTVNLDVDDEVEAKSYNIAYTINGDRHESEIEVLENYNWTLDYDEVNTSTTLRAGDDIYLGRVAVNNTGNMEVEIETEKQGDDKHMIVMQDGKTLYRKSKAFFDIQAQIPTVTKVGVYEYNIVFKGGSISKNFTLKLNVTDAIKPEIKTINFSTSRAFEDNEITVTATDNNEVTNLTLSYDNETVAFDKDANVFTRTLSFEKLSMYEFTFCAKDDSGNQDCVDINKTFEKASVIEGYDDVIKMPSVKQGEYSKDFLFNITEEVPDGVEVLIRTVEALDTDREVDEIVTFRVSKDDGSIKRFGDTTRKVLLKEPGSYYLEVRSNEKADVEGTLRFSMPEKYDAIDDATFKASFKDYDVPEDFTKNWFNDRTLECVVNDTGDLDTSFRTCSFTMPISVEKEDISVPMTISQKDDIDDEMEGKNVEIKDLKRQRNMILTFGSAVLLLFGLWIYYSQYVKPYNIFKMGETKEEYDSRK